MNKLEKFKGNILSKEEKEIRLDLLNEDIDDIDIEFLHYLNRINKCWFICTTQCCTGHYEDVKNGGRKSHIDFRCRLTEKDTIDLILRPLETRIGCTISICTELERLRYIIWLDNSNWKKDIEEFIKILEVIDSIYPENEYSDNLDNYLEDNY